jgi:Rrf2 family iron-sulfur cluster assembly transcriptional regulator
MIEKNMDSPLSLVSIAERQGLPLPYLEQIFLKLRKSNIVTSVRGFYGGYALAVMPSKLSLFDIVCAVDSIKITEACSGIVKGCSPHGALCLTHHLWAKIDTVVMDFLKNITLNDVITNINLKDMAFKIPEGIYDCVYK